MSSAFLILSLWSATLPEVQEVQYDVKVSVGSWEPISAKDQSRTIEHAALEVLSQPALMHLLRGKRSSEQCHLSIVGRTLAEAETHTVILTFDPGSRSTLPSAYASDTVSLAKLRRGKMLEAIERSARTAAERLLLTLKPALGRSELERRGAVPSPFEEVKTWPWRWEKVRVPKASLRRAKDLYSRNGDKRRAALRELTSLALSEASPRHVLERCALRHKEADMRKECLVALRPLSRRVEATRRVVIEVFRKETASSVWSEADKQMRYFTGVSRQLAVQAWMEAAAAGKTIGPLLDFGYLPNLDQVIRKCIYNRGKQNQHRCLDLLEPVPHARRRAILWRFVREKNPSSNYYLHAHHSAVQALLERAPRWDPQLEDVLWERYVRTLNEAPLHVLAEYATPSKRTVERLLEAVKTAGDGRSYMGLRRLSREDEAIRIQVRDALRALLTSGAYSKKISRHLLESAVRELEQHEKKK